jgi:glycosyltransferase involved in cell wall biosynthesis
VRVALVAPPYLTVPPQGYGGIEQVVALLANGLSGRGHDVTLYASEGSDTAADLAEPVDEAPGPEALGDEFPALAHALRTYEDAASFDVIHDHTVAGTTIGVALGRRPLVHTLHGPWTAAARRYYALVDDRVDLVAISHAQQGANRSVRYAGVVPNGIDVAAHPFRAEKDEYLVFVGRANPDKGPEVAVEVARGAGLPLVIVTKRAEPVEARHWEVAVEPLLDADVTVHDDLPHDEVLSIVSRARAMVFPIQWPEPFGLVMAEALACGTPVITRPLGAACEIVSDGETGFLCTDVDAMVRAVRQVRRLSPEACRQRALHCFSAESMVAGYERVYESSVARLR